MRCVVMLLEGFCRIAGFLNGPDEPIRVLIASRLPTNRGLPCIECNRGTTHSLHGLERLGDMPRAVAACHAIYGKLGHWRDIAVMCACFSVLDRLMAWHKSQNPTYSLHEGCR